MGGVYIAKSGITVRGMDRNSVVVDGTNPGSSPCSSKPSAQNYGSLGPDGVPVGRNGIVVWKANDVRVQNLTVCNFLAGTGASGNEIWWNGGRRVRQDRPDRLLGQLPDRDLDVLQQRDHGRASTASSPATRPARPAGISFTPAT